MGCGDLRNYALRLSSTTLAFKNKTCIARTWTQYEEDLFLRLLSTAEAKKQHRHLVSSLVLPVLPRLRPLPRLTPCGRVFRRGHGRQQAQRRNGHLRRRSSAARADWGGGGRRLLRLGGCVLQHFVWGGAADVGWWGWWMLFAVMLWMRMSRGDDCRLKYRRSMTATCGGCFSWHPPEEAEGGTRSKRQAVPVHLQ